MTGVLYQALAAMAIGYLLGCIPTGYLVARWKKGIDIRKVGSRNMGTMNVLREVGPAEAALVLLVDAGKGIGAVAISRMIGYSPAIEVPALGAAAIALISHSPAVEVLAGAAAIAGHDFPLFLRFRGGMGGATGMGILLFLMPWSAPFYFGITALVFLPTRNLTVSYGAAFLVFPFVSWFVYGSLPYLAFSLAVDLSLFLYNIPRISAIRQKGVRNPGFKRK